VAKGAVVRGEGRAWLSRFICRLFLVVQTGLSMPAVSRNRLSM